MLMVPASNVSVPLTVVTRTRSRDPESVREPPPITPEANVDVVILDAITQRLEPAKAITALPLFR